MRNTFVKISICTLLMSIFYMSTFYMSTSVAAMSEPVSNTTIGKWSMDTGEGTLAVDSINTFYKPENLEAKFLSYGSPPVWSTDTPNGNGYSLDFNGLSSGLVIPANEKLDTGKFSLSIWVKPEATVASYQAIYSSRGAAQGFIIYATPQNNWEFWLQSPTGWDRVVGPALQQNVWTHLVVTYDSNEPAVNNKYTGTGKLYVNGNLSAQGTNLEYEPNTVSATGIGYRGSSNQYFFNGKIDQTEFFDGAMNSTEVTDKYNNLPVSTPVMAQWLMNEGTGKVVIEPFSEEPNPLDAQQYNHPGIFTNNPLWSADSPSGNGYSLDFDGIDDGVLIAANEELNLGSFSLSLWVKVEGDSGSYRIPIGSRGGNGGFQIYAANDNTWQFWLNSHGSWDKVVGSTIKEDTWQHIVATFEANGDPVDGVYTGRGSLYVDGVLEQQLINLNYQTNTTSAMGIGYRGSANQYNFNGKIDEVEIIAGSLTASEVATKSKHIKSQWLFNQGNGSYAFDSEGELTGEFIGTPQWVSTTRSLIGKALSFDGTSGVKIPANDVTNNASFSVSSWVYVNPGSSAYQAVVSSRNGSESFIIYVDNNNKWNFWTGDSMGFSKLIGDPVITSSWVHVTAVYQANGEADVNGNYLGTGSLYVNGALQGLLQNMKYKPNTSTDMGIGYRGGVSQFFFNGMIDDVEIYGRNLSSAQVNEIYTSGTVKSFASPWDKGTQTQEIDPALDPGDITPGSNPITYTSLYKREREMYGYDPRFFPNMPTFDGSGRPVLVAGVHEGKGNNSTVYPSYAYGDDQYIQRLENDEWKAYSVTDIIRSAFSLPEWNGSIFSGVKLIHEKVEFDDSGDAYLLACLDNPPVAQQNWVLLYSKGGQNSFKNWQGYTLPAIGDECLYHKEHYNFQAYTPHSNRSIPPALIYDQSNVVPLTKGTQGLTIGTPTSLIGTNTSITDFAAGYTHSGGLNSTATVGDVTHFVFARLDSNLGNNTTDTDMYYSSYNHVTDTVVDPVYLTTTGSCCLSPDNHNIPFILSDSTGKLHVVAGSHQKEFKYLTAETHSNGTINGAWSTAVDVVSLNENLEPYNTYPGMAIDSQNNIHLVFRKVDAQNRYSLHYMYKPAAGQWQDKGELVIPASGTYSVYYHKLTMDNQGRLFLTYFYYHHFLTATDEGEYKDRWPLELIKTGGIAEVNLYSGIKAHNSVILMSDNGGTSWKLAKSGDLAQ